MAGGPPGVYRKTSFAELMRLTGPPVSLFVYSGIESINGLFSLRTSCNWFPARLALATLFIRMALALPALSAQSLWTTVGPDGGDARSLGAVPGEPSHLYMGTTNSWIYESLNEGASWRRLAKLDKAGELVIDHILVDPANPSLIYAPAWKFGHPDGGLWISHDGGKTWTSNPGMKGQSIRAFAQAPSNPRILFAGTLKGVFRSRDAGSSWQQISPVGSSEIH